MNKSTTAFKLIVIAALAFALWSAPGSAIAGPVGLCYVDADAGGTGTGSSWANAYTSLQSALGNSSCLEIWVAQGVYKPGTTQGETLSIPSGVAVYGGFAGTEVTRDQRDPYANITVLSADIDSNDTNTDGNFIAESVAHIQGSNAYHVVVIGEKDPALASTRLDGFTITAGKANGGSSFDESGAGLYCLGSGQECSPTLANLVFSGNDAAENGGGVYNQAINGGVSSPSLTDITFTGNHAGYSGGGICNASQNVGTASPTLSRVTFNQNAAASGGGMANTVDAVGTSSPTLTNVTFYSNMAPMGGALYNYAFNGTASPTLANVTFTGNAASVYGGAMYNSATGGTSVIAPTLSRVILWGDTAGEAGPEIENYSASGAVVNPTINYSVMQGGCTTGNTCSNLVATDPKLGILADNTGRTRTVALLGGSSAVDAGDDTSCPDVDQRGIKRVRGAHCDIGAYEKVPYVPSDFDDDGKTDPVLFTGTSAWWRNSNGGTWSGAYLGPGTYVRRSNFDGDAKAGPAKFDATNSLWYLESSSGHLHSRYMGPGTYEFVAGSDYEGDGKTDAAQFNTSVNALWYFGSNDSAWHGTYLGPGTYDYVAGSDFDGDGRADPAHWNWDVNVLWYMRSSDSTWQGVYLGPISGSFSYVEASDYDGDGRTDPAQFNGTTNTLWYIPSSGGAAVGVWMGPTPMTYLVPAVDFDGDGFTDPAGFVSSSHLLWYWETGSSSWKTFDMGAGSYDVVN